MVYSWMKGACEWKVCAKLPYVNVCLILYSTCNVRKCIRWFERIDTLDYLISLQTSCVLYYNNFLLKLYKIDGYIQTLFIQILVCILIFIYHQIYFYQLVMGILFGANLFKLDLSAFNLILVSFFFLDILRLTFNRLTNAEIFIVYCVFSKFDNSTFVLF